MFRTLSFLKPPNYYNIRNPIVHFATDHKMQNDLFMTFD